MANKDEEIEAMREAIAGVYAKHSPEETSSRGIITNFIVLTEVVGDDGEYWVRRISDKGPMWRTLGILDTFSDDIRTALRSPNNI